MLILRLCIISNSTNVRNSKIFLAGIQFGRLAQLHCYRKLELYKIACAERKAQGCAGPRTGTAAEATFAETVSYQERSLLVMFVKYVSNVT